MPLYQTAAELDPKQAAPLFNLSTALFELGDYNGYDEVCASALALLQGEPQETAAKHKIHARQARARLATRRTEKTKAAVNLLFDRAEKMSLLHCLKNCHSSQVGVKDAKESHTKLFLELPRYEPMICVHRFVIDI